MFVVFEGIDGSGKTTISNQVAERLRARGLRVKHLREGGEFASPVTQAIRELGRDAKNLELVPETEFLLFVARDVQLVQQVLLPAIATHDLIIADRFFYTAEVLAHHGRHLDRSFVDPIIASASRGLQPELVVLVDVEPKLARLRRKSAKLMSLDKRPPSRKGLTGVGLQQRLRKGYLELAEKAPERWAVVENDAALEESITKVTELIAGALRAGAADSLSRFQQEKAAKKRTPAREVRTIEQAFAAFLAWVDAHLEHEPKVAALILAGLAGSEVNQRRLALADRVPKAVLLASAGLEDEQSWAFRHRFETEYPDAVARSLAGLEPTNERAVALRRRLVRLAPIEVLRSISGQDEDEAWHYRDMLGQGNESEVVASLTGISTSRAWALRSAWLSARQELIVTDYETAKLAAKSVAGLADDLAWEWRTMARAAAPVSALSSIRLLTTPESWRWRREFVKRAPKVVMATLRRIDEPQAWELRRLVAYDCKEALDSISGLDSEPAWALREAYQDVWPSTVVKSLGQLVEGPRGQALLERQLANYQSNLSLLQHAAAIALRAYSALPED